MHISKQDKERLEKRNFRWLAGSIGITLAVLGVSLLFQGPDIDETTNCPKDIAHRDTRATTLLIDLTDRLEGMKASNAVSLARSVAQSLHRFERFSIFVLKSKSTSDLAPIYSGCNPGKPTWSDISTWSDYVSKGRREIGEQFELKFANRLSETISAELKNQVGSKESPIIEAIRDITHSEYWGKTNRLYVMSDLLEHSKIASLYDPNQTFQSVIKSPRGTVMNTIDLSSAIVGICPIDHPAGELAAGVESNAIKFWKSFFDYTKAGCIEISCQLNGNECAGRERGVANNSGNTPGTKK